MSKREAVSRYNLIIKKIRRNPSTFVQIQDYLDLESSIQEYNFRISKRTFQRDLEDIRSIYNIDIQYDFSAKTYYIKDELDIDLSNRVLEAFDIFNALNVGERLSQNLLFESRKPIGTEHLQTILNAIDNQQQLFFKYQKYWEESPTSRIAKPLVLKEFKHRWYLLAIDVKDDRKKTFALDRITSLEIQKTYFERPYDFEARQFFANSFGIISPEDQKCETIILSFTKFQGKYIKSLPLHQTQKILVDNDEELRIQLDIYATHDFIMEILSFGNEVKILAPNWLQNEIKQRLNNALKRYE